MPYFELLSYLASNGDSVLSKTAEKIITENGDVYIRSYSGMANINGSWVKRYILCRG